MNFSVDINCDNDAFGPHLHAELAEILTWLATRVNDTETRPTVIGGWPIGLYDTNGNRVGEARMHLDRDALGRLADAND